MLGFQQRRLYEGRLALRAALSRFSSSTYYSTARASSTVFDSLKTVENTVLLSAAIMSSDPQTWVYPPREVSSSPIAETASFGPVYLQDSMVLEWDPATKEPEVNLWCLSLSGGESN
jgi:hypothetical protein